MKAFVTVTLDNGSLSWAANVANSEAIAILEAGKYAILSQAMGVGSAGRPPEEPQGPAGGGRRALGLQPRQVDRSG